MDKLSNFVTHVLSRRNDQVRLSSFKLYLHGEHAHDVAQRIMNHAFSLNVHRVKFKCLLETGQWYTISKVKFPLSLSGSQTLKRLTLIQGSCPCDEIVLTSAQEFSSLTTLHLRFVSFYDGFLSMGPILKNLTLVGCKVTGSPVLTIRHPRLSNLTIDKGDFWTPTVNVVAPRLKNLTILRHNGKFRVSTPKLASLLLRGPYPSMFSSDGFPGLKKAILLSQSADASIVISLLQQLYHVKYLSLSMEIIEVSFLPCNDIIYLYIVFLIDFSTVSEFIRGTDLTPAFPAC
ncbi:putative leucine-rich repeat domain superfamily [Helianthus annuus]|nr:putative leucine-rich repeat domain superfamily [Helianthus annuus]